MAGWLLLDVRWGANLQYLDRGVLAFSTASAGRGYLPIENDAAVFDFVQRVRQLLATEPLAEKRIFILSATADDFRALRAKYLLLPLPAVVGPGDKLLRRQNTNIHYLASLDAPGSVPPEAAQLEEQLAGGRSRKRLHLREVLRTEAGALYRIVDGTGISGPVRAGREASRGKK